MRNLFLLLTLLSGLSFFSFEPVSAQTAPVKKWDRDYGGDEYDAPAIIIPTSDGNYLIGGNSLSNIYCIHVRNLRGNGDPE